MWNRFIYAEAQYQYYNAHCENGMHGLTGADPKPPPPLEFATGLTGCLLLFIVLNVYGWMIEQVGQNLCLYWGKSILFTELIDDLKW